jgi:hypothetical protein
MMYKVIMLPVPGTGTWLALVTFEVLDKRCTMRSGSYVCGTAANSVTPWSSVMWWGDALPSSPLTEILYVMIVFCTGIELIYN